MQNVTKMTFFNKLKFNLQNKKTATFNKMLLTLHTYVNTITFCKLLFILCEMLRKLLLPTKFNFTYEMRKLSLYMHNVSPISIKHLWFIFITPKITV